MDAPVPEPFARGADPCAARTGAARAWGADARDDDSGAVSEGLPRLGRRVLVVEHDVRGGRLIVANLNLIGCEHRWVDDGAAALAEMSRSRFDLVLLDLVLSGADGGDVLRRLRRGGHRMPVLLMAASARELSRALELEPMAEDVLIKPFGALELAARALGVLRRAGATAQLPRPIEAEDLLIDLQRRQVTLRGRAVELTAKEFELLAQLASSPGRVFSRAELLDRVWGFARDVFEHTVASHINRLRSKIELDPTNPSYIQTVWGAGYRFAEGSGGV